MPQDLFNLTTGVEPMDMTDVVSPQAPAPAPKDQKREWLKLAMLLPLVMKGGPGALQGFVSGLNQSNVYNNQQSRLQANDAAVAQQRQDVIAQRDRALEAQTANLLEQRKQDLLKLFFGELGKTKTEADVQALLSVVGPQAQALGIPAGRLAGFAAQTQTPARTRTRLITQAWERLGESAKKTALEQPQFVIPLGDGTVADVSEVAKAVGLPIDPTTGKPPIAVPKVDVPNTSEEKFYQRYATEHGVKAFEELPTTEQAKARKQWMQADDRPLAPVAPGALPAATQRRVDAKARAFDALPLVKRTQTMAEAVTFADGLDINTKNPADDQALIYSFAKAMDPDSVVREGEYATVQKYAQSWAERFGFDVSRIFSNTQFLTPQARENMKATIRAKFVAGRGQYENVRRSYISQINKITQQEDGDSYLTDYGGAFPSAPSEATVPTRRTAPGPNPFRGAR